MKKGKWINNGWILEIRFECIDPKDSGMLFCFCIHRTDSSKLSVRFNTIVSKNHCYIGAAFTVPIAQSCRYGLKYNRLEKSLLYRRCIYRTDSEKLSVRFKYAKLSVRVDIQSFRKIIISSVVHSPYR